MSDTGPRKVLSLVVTDGGTSVVVDVPPSGEATIGRDSSCAVRVALPSISRKHATIAATPGGKLRITDLGSKNGTFVGDSRLVTGEGARVALGEPFRLGDAVAVVVRASPPRARAPRGRSANDHDVAITPALAPLEAMVAKIAPTQLPVLFLGETGVGKDVFAERVHVLSPRRKGPLVRVHAAAIAEGLFESELFGHEAGAFTGAVRAKVGLLESADGGTVFIDEVGELPPSIQVKLLRVLEDKRVQRVGATSSLKVDVRFVAATHVDLATRVAEGSFRADLFQRLRGVTVRIPPLRERRADIPALAAHLLDRAAPRRTFAKAALAALAKMPFFGNVRELKNLVERTALLGDDAEIPVSALAEAMGDAPDASADEREAARIRGALERARGNQTRAAELLGVSRRTLVYKLDALGLARPRKKNVEAR